MKEAFFQFKIEVVELGNLEDVVNCVSVVIKGGASGDSDVVHVDTDCCPKGFVFEDDVPVYIVHHGLECRWRIGEPEVHDSGFEEPVSGFKCGFLLVSFMNLYVVIPPSDIELHVYVCVTEVSNKVRN